MSRSLPTPTQPSLETRVVDDASRWIQEWSSRLLVDGRSMSGGWPGTMSEARQRVVACTHMREPNALAALTKLLYNTAKSAWISKAHADRE